VVAATWAGSLFAIRLGEQFAGINCGDAVSSWRPPHPGVRHRADHQVLVTAIWHRARGRSWAKRKFSPADQGHLGAYASQQRNRSLGTWASVGLPNAADWEVLISVSGSTAARYFRCLLTLPTWTPRKKHGRAIGPGCASGEGRLDASICSDWMTIPATKNAQGLSHRQLAPAREPQTKGLTTLRRRRS